MIALLIHFLGHLCVDSAIPPYIGSADATFLSLWYAAFAAVDLIAICFATNKRISLILTFSFAWSVALSIEQLLLLDVMQSTDWLMQPIIDFALIGYLAIELFGMRREAIRSDKL